MSKIVRTKISVGNVEFSTDSYMRTTVTIEDWWRQDRKTEKVVVLEDLAPWQLSHLAKQCMRALRNQQRRLENCVDEVLEQ